MALLWVQDNMCGIVFARDKHGARVNNLVKTLYHNQAVRGKEGFGFLARTTKDHVLNRKAISEKEIMKMLAHVSAKDLLFHHRSATTADIKVEACHPFEITLDGKIFTLVHNGTVLNAKDLFKEHILEGIKYTSGDGTDKNLFNDSEALAFDVALFLTKKQKEIRARGFIAFICIRRDQKTGVFEKIYFYRNPTRPLQILNIDDVFVLASDGGPAFKDVNPNKIFQYNYKTKKISCYKEFIFTQYIEVQRLGSGIDSNNFRKVTLPFKGLAKKHMPTEECVIHRSFICLNYGCDGVGNFKSYRAGEMYFTTIKSVLEIVDEDLIEMKEQIDQYENLISTGHMGNEQAFNITKKLEASNEMYAELKRVQSNLEYNQ